MQRVAAYTYFICRQKSLLLLLLFYKPTTCNDNDNNNNNGVPSEARSERNRNDKTH